MSIFFEDVLVLLRDAGVQFVVVGGTAVILHGVPRTTADLDIVVDLEDPANVLRLVAAMDRLGYVPRAPVDASELADPERRKEWIEEKSMLAFTFQRPSRPLEDVDIILASPVGYRDLVHRSELIDAGGIAFRIAGISDLIRMKEAAGRQQDLSDADALRRLQEAYDE